jgi:hypothetical protein
MTAGDGQARLAMPEGRRLVSGGNKDFEIAAEVRTIDDEDYLFQRVWLQQIQKFRVTVLSREGSIESTVVKPTYREAVDAVYDELGI